jgi:uncharacterized membrane protein
MSAPRARLALRLKMRRAAHPCRSRSVGWRGLRSICNPLSARRRSGTAHTSPKPRTEKGKRVSFHSFNSCPKPVATQMLRDVTSIQSKSLSGSLAQNARNRATCPLAAGQFSYPAAPPTEAWRGRLRQQHIHGEADRVVLFRGAETHARSVLKAVSWRTLGTLDTFAISWFMTGRVEVAGSIAGLEIITKIAWYYLHERLWASIPWGRR